MALHNAYVERMACMFYSLNKYVKLFIFSAYFEQNLRNTMMANSLYIVFMVFAAITSDGRTNPWMGHLQKTNHHCLKMAGSHLTMEDSRGFQFRCFRNVWNECKSRQTVLGTCKPVSNMMCGQLEVAGFLPCQKLSWSVRVSRHFTLNITFLKFHLRQARSGRCLYSEVRIINTADVANNNSKGCNPRTIDTIFFSNIDNL